MQKDGPAPAAATGVGPAKGGEPPVGRARPPGLLRRCLAAWIWPRWRALAGALLLMAGLAAATGAYPQIIKHAFDGLSSGRLEMVWSILVVIVLVTMLRALLLYLTATVTSRIVLRMAVDIQKQVFAHLLQSDYARLARDAPGELVSRLTNDVQLVQQAVQAGINTAVRDSLMIAALVAYMFYTDWVMSLIVLGVYPLAILPIAQIGQRLKRVAKRTQAELGDMTSLLSEKLAGARLIKTFRLEGYAARRLSESFDQIFTLRMKAVRNRAKLDPMLEAFGGIAVAGVVALATWRISSGINTIGDFMAFVTALFMAAQPTRGLGNLNAKVQEGLAAAERIFALLDEAPRIVDKAGAKPLTVGAGAITFDRVGFAYDGGPEHSRAIRDFTLDVRGGATVALVGRSGAGKSTIINLVPRLFDATEGRILIDGQDIRDVTVASLRDAIAIVSQDVTLFDDTIRANIALGRLGASEDEIVAAAKAAAAHEFILAQPNGYQTTIGDRGQRLSGGQRQRLALARAILKNAPILLLDEATSALDADSERLVQEALARFTRNRTTLVIAHRLSTVQSADLICVMDDGTLIESGTHADLLAQGGTYARLTRTQLFTAEPAAEAPSETSRAPA
ncbi:MAG: ABC transporter ATP-binding protein [Hyphomicrobiaceae bacterium]